MNFSCSVLKLFHFFHDGRTLFTILITDIVKYICLISCQPSPGGDMHCLCIFQDLLLGLVFSNTENLIGDDAFLIDYPGTSGHLWVLWENVLVDSQPQIFFG